MDPFRQMVDLSGPALLSAWLLALNGCMLGAVVAEPWSSRVAAWVVAALLVGGSALYGTHQLNEPPPSTRQTEALLIQPALPPGVWSDTTRTARIDTLLRHTETALHGTSRSGVALVVWPETALPPLPNPSAQDALYERLRRWVARNDVTLLTGAIEPASTLAGGARTYHNAALLIRADTVQRYRKNYLVPFAEHVPLSEYIPALRAFNVPAGGVAGYERSTQQPPLQTPGFRLGALICLESVFSHHIRAYLHPSSTERPVDFLVTIAQNGWWGPTAGYQQHLAFSQLRAVAVRRAMAFVAVSGGTALIDAQGRRHAYAPWMKPTARRVAIPHGTEQSVYVQYGDWVSLLALLASVGLGGITLFHYLFNR
jgi:apolipoprotein N-acyltransferase